MAGQPSGYLCQLDESIVAGKSKNPFFVYGGLLIPLDALASLDARLATLRATAGFPDSVPLKWVAPGGQITPATHARAKEQLLDALVASGCELFVSLTPAAVAKGARARDQALRFGANGVLRAVHEVLVERDGRALITIDQFPGTSPISFIEEKGSIGLIYPGTKARLEPLDRMVGFCSTSAKAGRIGSLIDVALGGFAYCLDPGGRGKVGQIAPKVMPLVSRDRGGNVAFCGVSFYPTTMKNPDHAKACNQLSRILAGFGLKGLPTYQ